MKSEIILIKAFILILLMSCNAAEKESAKAVAQDKFILTGRIENAGELESVRLLEGETATHAIELESNGGFNFEGSTPDEALYTLLVGERSFMLVLKNGEKVEFNADLSNPDHYTVKGSETSAKLQKLDAIRQKFDKEQVKLHADFEKRIDSGETMLSIQNDLMAKNERYVSELSEKVLQFFLENKDNLAGFYGMMTLYSVDPTAHEEAIIEHMEEFREKFPNNQDVQSFASHIEEIKPLSIGQQAPDFSSLTPEGKEVKLSDFRGQYVLLDFWAAWCAPCREENPNIVSQYHKFKDKGFTVVGLSLDSDRDAWLKAINDDKLVWTQLSDLKMWDSEAGRLYNITAIPASFMIDPEGKIIGKNLRGPALQRFLERNL
ncbi:TlpA disulfide reductase family protein [Cyclobacterium roseum]|uniref:TlpA disulfide reductase family protein n=1 Tax=Cyclobacterium roseum TaxID=2666137 RepID=UPI001F3D8817|nr:TlpA disulfide reductase family protein [Cyclobacterium roseum]